MQLVGLSDQEEDNINANDSPHPPKLQTDNLIEPWGANLTQSLVTHKNLKKQTHVLIVRGGSERKPSIDERLGDMYRKYSKDAPVRKTVSRINSREVYRRQLQQFQGGIDFKQIGCPRESVGQSQQLDDYYLQKLKLQSTSKVMCCDTREMRLAQEPPISEAASYFSKSNNRFQRVLKIKDKIRRKNSMAISKQRKQCQALWPYSQVKPKEAVLPEKAEKMAKNTRIRLGQTQYKSKKDTTTDWHTLEVVGVYSNALQYILQRQRHIISMKGVSSNYKMLQTYQSLKR